MGYLPANELNSFQFSVNTLPTTIQETLSQAYQSSPVYHASLRRILAAESSSQMAESDYRPKVHLNARYGSQTYDGSGYNDGQSEASIGVELRYNLYSGGKHRANIRRSLQEINVAKDQRDLACINIRQNVQIAYNDTLKLAEQLPILNRHRLASSKVATAYKQQFDIGQRTLLDVLDIENELFQAGRAWVNAHYDLEIARAKTLASMGGLVKTLGLQRSNLPTLSDLGAEPIHVDEATACPTIEAMPSKPVASTNITDQCANAGPDLADQLGCVLTTKKQVSHHLNIPFDKESIVVQQQYYKEIAKLADFLKRYGTTKVSIEGHSSLGGSNQYNLRLSKERADAVAAILNKTYGIDAARISTVGYGFTRLIKNENSPEANKINRRIEAVVTATTEVTTKR